MSSTLRGVTALVCLAVMVGAAGVWAQDWPQWRGPDRNGHVTEFTPPEVWPEALTEAWRVIVGPADATPALVGERLYIYSRVGDDEVTRCLNAADGVELWQSRTVFQATAVSGPAGSHPGPRGTPAVAEGKVVTLGVGGILSCTDAETGALQWRADPFPGVVPQFYTSCSPLIADGLAIAQLGGRGNGAILAYDLATGEEKWRWAGEAPQYASPVLMTVGETKMVVTFTELSLVGVSVADGALLWQVPFAPQGRAYNATTPIVDGDTVYITGAGRGTKALRIAPEGEGFTATELWTNAGVACQFCTPVLREGLLFGLNESGRLFCLRADTGEQAWLDDTPRGRGGFGAMVSAGPLVFALGADSMLIGFTPTAEGFQQVVSYKVAETPVYAYPVIAGNRIYIKDQDAVTAWTIE